ncbi:hypothetical protein THAOC_07861 [Thalassiosira oceanica]|uniref:Uncharacterized protein n=1 Tax=Thalassiosira oceanica TaxID=159749 RepID=K0TBG1_THAOC|nr:hypothetical protein THAOC_07861 [Thalassiosira oceanica]|eukprot:EJK70751.1 hypothetical protein THAOC_07861 [Thalassiosira oceanica]
MAVSAMSRRLLRAAGGLRRPSESRSLPTFPSTIYFMMCGGLTSQPTFESDISSMQRRTKDPKTMASHSGIRGIMPSTSRRRRCISSISSCPRNNFGRESVHFARRAARLEKRSPWTWLHIDHRIQHQDMADALDCAHRQITDSSTCINIEHQCTYLNESLIFAVDLCLISLSLGPRDDNAFAIGSGIRFVFTADVLYACMDGYLWNVFVSPDVAQWPSPMIHSTLHALTARDDAAELTPAAVVHRLHCASDRNGRRMASYDARGHGGWRPHVNDGVYTPVTSSIRPPDTHDSCRRRRDHPADARRFELRRRDQWAGTGPRTLVSEDTMGRRGLPRTMG